VPPIDFRSTSTVLTSVPARSSTVSVSAPPSVSTAMTSIAVNVPRSKLKSGAPSWAYIDLERVRRARRERSRGGSPGGPCTVTSRIGRADRGSLRMTFIMPSFRSV
jgi:hypothetical protein